MEISIAQACIYKDGRCHGVFTDGSGLIFHRGGQYCTYFSQTGEISRQVTACTVGGTKAKVLKLIKLYNSYCVFPICTFAEEIYKVLSKETKVLSGTFQVPGQITVVCKSELVRTVQYTPAETIAIVEQDSNGALKYSSADNEVTLAMNANAKLFKVSYPLMLPHRKPNWSEGPHKKVRLNYEYVKVSQVLHIANCQEWAPILDILQSASGKDPQYLPTEDIIIVLPTQTTGEIWSDDSVSPAVSFFNYFKENLFFYWEPQASFYITSNISACVMVHEDQSLLESNRDFFTHFRKDGEIKFTSDTVPSSSRGNYLSGLVSRCKEFQTFPVQIKIPENIYEEPLLDGVKFENEVEGLGNFIAYNDKSIRVLFQDRTLIRIYHDFTVSAISRTGDHAKFNLDKPFGFEQYIPVCVEFYNWAFLSQTELAQRTHEAQERETLVAAEISRNERLNYHPGGQCPGSIEENLQSTKKQLEETKALLSKINKF